MSKELIKEFEENFEAMKKETGLKASLEELDHEFHFRDFIEERKFVPHHLSRALCARIVDGINGWYGFLHGIIVPNPQSMVNITESQVFNDKEKKEIMHLMNKIIAIISTNTKNMLIKDNKVDAEFIDHSLNFWKEIRPKLKEILTKVNDTWKEKASKPPEEKKQDTSHGTMFG